MAYFKTKHLDIPVKWKCVRKWTTVENASSDSHYLERICVDTNAQVLYTCTLCLDIY